LHVDLPDGHDFLVEESGARVEVKVKVRGNLYGAVKPKV
jgi:hypothetical protein